MGRRPVVSRRKLNEGIAPDNDGREGLRRTARFYENNNGLYRPILTREWGLGQPTVVIIGVNPSKADHLIDDPTIKADYRHCDAWGFSRLIKLNLFDLVATEPKDMAKHPHPEGPSNWDAFREVFEKPATKLVTVCAWGNWGKHNGQDWAVLKWLEYWEADLKCMGTNQNGTPKHPLYMKPGTLLRRFTW